MAPSHRLSPPAGQAQMVALEQRLHAVTQMCDLERQERKALHNRLVVSSHITHGGPTGARQGTAWLPSVSLQETGRGRL